MSRLEQLIAELCPNGVEYKALGEIGTMVRGNGLQKKDFTDTGVGCIHYGQIYTYYGAFAYKTKTFVSAELAKQLKKVNKGDLVIAITSENVKDVCKCVAWLGDEEIVTGGHSVIFKHNQDPKYLSYCFQTSDFFIQKKKIARGTKVIEVSPQKLEKVVIPLPPLPVQQEIVRILDKFTELKEELTAQLTAELTAKRKQYEYYRNLLLTFGDEVEWRPLGEIADIGTGSSNTNEELDIGKYPFFVRSQEVRRKNTYEYDETAIITAGDGVGVGKIFHYIEGKYALHQRAYRIHITDSRVIPKYYFYYMKSTFLPYIEKSSFHSSVTSIRRPMLNNFPVPIPSIQEQERIIAILDRFEALCDDMTSDLTAEIEARQKQYEYYRDKLLSFKEVSA